MFRSLSIAWRIILIGCWLHAAVAPDAATQTDPASGTKSSGKEPATDPKEVMEISKTNEKAIAEANKEAAAKKIDTPSVPQYKRATAKCVENSGGWTRAWGYFMDLDINRYTEYKRQLITACWDVFTADYPGYILQPTSIVDYIVHYLTGITYQNGGSTKKNYIYYYYNLLGGMMDVATAIIPKDFDKEGTKYKFYNVTAHKAEAETCIDKVAAAQAARSSKAMTPKQYFCDLSPSYYKENKLELLQCVWNNLMLIRVSRQFIYPPAVVQSLYEKIGCEAPKKSGLMSWLWSWWPTKPHAEQVKIVAKALIPTDQFYFYYGMTRTK